MDLDQADGWFRSGNRQIVKSTVIADWQQKAGSWSAQRGGVGDGDGDVGAVETDGAGEVEDMREDTLDEIEGCRARDGWGAASRRVF